MKTNNDPSGKVLIEPELSYIIVGAAYSVYNQLGYGYQEKFYQKSFALELKRQGILFQRELPVTVRYQGEMVGLYRLDFLVAERVVVELKVQPFFRNVHLPQVLGYLSALEKELAIVLFFTRDGVRVQRVVNPRLRAGSTSIYS